MGRARRTHRGQGEEEHDATTRDRQGTGPSNKVGRGGSGHEVDGDDRGSKGPLDRKTMGPTETLAQVEAGKGGNRTVEGSQRLL